MASDSESSDTAARKAKRVKRAVASQKSDAAMEAETAKRQRENAAHRAKADRAAGGGGGGGLQLATIDQLRREHAEDFEPKPDQDDEVKATREKPDARPMAEREFVDAIADLRKHQRPVVRAYGSMARAATSSSSDAERAPLISATHFKSLLYQAGKSNAVDYPGCSLPTCMASQLERSPPVRNFRLRAFMTPEELQLLESRGFLPDGFKRTACVYCSCVLFGRALLAYRNAKAAMVFKGMDRQVDMASFRVETDKPDGFYGAHVYQPKSDEWEGFADPVPVMDAQHLLWKKVPGQDCHYLDAEAMYCAPAAAEASDDGDEVDDISREVERAMGAAAARASAAASAQSEAWGQKTMARSGRGAELTAVEEPGRAPVLQSKAERARTAQISRPTNFYH